MAKSINNLKTLIGLCCILLQVSNNWCTDLSPSIVKIVWNLQYLCSGILIKENFVLSSAECFRYQNNPKELLVMANVDLTQFKAADIAAVEEIIKPQAYNDTTGYMDVAILKLKQSFPPNIKPAQLCGKDSIEADAPLTLYNRDIYAHGWTEATAPMGLLKTNLVVSKSDFCAEKSQNKYTETMFCAVTNKGSACLYDKSGPATVDGELCAYYIFGPTCINNDSPGAFTSLANREVKQFIQETLQNK